MRFEEMLLLMAEYPYRYLLALSLNCLFAVYIIKRYIRNYFDPLFIVLIGVVFANTVLLFLFFANIQNWETISSFLGIELLFWIGFIHNRLRKIHKFSYVELNSEGKFFNFCFLLIVCFQLLYFSEQGLPIFQDSRIDRYKGAVSGLGIFERLSYVMKMFCSLYSFLHFNDKHRKKSRLYLLYLVVVSVLNGGKSALISLVTPAFFIYHFFTNIRISKMKYIITGGVVLFFAVLVVYISSGTLENAVFIVIARFMMYGDIYFESLGNNVISEVKIQYPINDLLVNILAPFRLMDYSTNVDIAPSLQVHRYIYPELSDLLSGPNNRLPFLYQCLFGSAIAYILSYITGRFVSWGMYKSQMVYSNNLVGFSIFAVLYVTLLQFPTDPILCLGNMVSWVIGSIFITIIYGICKHSKRAKL